MLSASARIWLIRFLGFLGILGCSFCLFSISTSISIKSPMENQGSEPQKYWYSVWALPAEDVRDRVKKLMEGLRSEYGGPEFEPHVTVVGAIYLTEEEATQKFKTAVEGVKVYNASVQSIATGTFFFQCVFLLLDPTPEVVETSANASRVFGYENSTPYMPHMSLLYADLTEEEKKKAQEKANALDETISSLRFPLTRFVLYKTDTGDKSLNSWQKIDECKLLENN